MENYVFKGDMIARGGNKRYDSERILDKVLKINQRSLEENISMDEALINLFLEEWYAELDPSSDKLDLKDINEQKGKVSTYFSNFWSKNPEKVEGLEEKYEKYSTSLKDYSVILLSQSIEKKEEFFKGEFSSFMKQKASNFGYEVDNHCHKIVAYKESINQVAKRVNNVLDLQ